MTLRLRHLTALTAGTALLSGLLVGAAVLPASADPGAAVRHMSTYVDGSGIRHIVGEVTNTGTVDLLAPHIDLQIRDSGGTVVDAPFGDAMVNVLAPGESSPFEVQTSVSDVGDYRVVAVSADPSSTPPNHNLAVSITHVFRDDSGNRQIGGTVRNDNTTSADEPQLVFTFYDASGTVVGGETAFTDTGRAIEPGQTAAFTEVVNPDIPAYSSYTVLAQSSSPAARNPAAPPAEQGTPAAETTLNCNPRMTLSSKAIVTGQGVTVTVAGTPGSVVTLEGYSRPSTDYAPIRRDVQLDGAGQAQPFVVRPSTAARVRLQVRGCSTPGTGQVITVTPVLTITTERLSPFQYRFAGKINPAVANTGRAISLYYKAPGQAPVRKGIARSLKDGTYSATLSFLRSPTQRLEFFWGTGGDMTNSAATSAVRSLLVY